MIEIPNDEGAKFVRKHTAQLLRVLAEISDDPKESQSVKKEALATLNSALARLKEIKSDPDTPKDIRTDIEQALRRFLHS